MNKRGILGLIIVLIVLFIGGFVLFWNENKDEILGNSEPINLTCSANSLNPNSCVKVQTTCCPCSSGGVEKCVLKSEAKEYEDKLKDCSPDLICAEVYNCRIESCECVEGNCTEVLIES